MLVNTQLTLKLDDNNIITNVPTNVKNTKDISVYVGEIYQYGDKIASNISEYLNHRILLFLINTKLLGNKIIPCWRLGHKIDKQNKKK